MMGCDEITCPLQTIHDTCRYNKDYNCVRRVKSSEIERLQRRVAHLVEAIQHCDEWESHESDCPVNKWGLAESTCDCLYGILHAAVEATKEKKDEVVRCDYPRHRNPGLTIPCPECEKAVEAAEGNE